MSRIIGKIWGWIRLQIIRSIHVIMKMLGKEISPSRDESILQFVKFGIVGFSNTVVAYLVYVVVLLFLRSFQLLPTIDYFMAQVVSFLLSVLWSYYWNSKKVFKVEENERRSWWKALIKTYITYSFTGLLLNALLLFIQVEILGISEFIAPIVNLIITVPLNYLINKYWAFKPE